MSMVGKALPINCPWVSEDRILELFNLGLIHKQLEKWAMQGKTYQNFQDLCPSSLNPTVTMK